MSPATSVSGVYDWYRTISPTERARGAMLFAWAVLGTVGVLALICRETAERGVEFLLQAKADPGNIGYLQFCPTIQSTWENIRGLKAAKPPPFAECLDPTAQMKIVYRAKHNEEGSRFWQKSNENMILFAEKSDALTIPEETHCWASLSQIKQMMLLDNVVNPYVRTVLAPL